MIDVVYLGKAAEIIPTGLRALQLVSGPGVLEQDLEGRLIFISGKSVYEIKEKT